MPSKKATRKWRNTDIYERFNKENRPRDDAKGKRLLETVMAMSISQV